MNLTYLKKLNIFLMLVLLFSTISCQEDEPIDPIVGNWKLVKKSVNRSFVNLSECLLQKNIEFYSDGKVIFNNYYIEDGTENCEFQKSTKTWSGGNNGNYGVDSGSIFNQNRSLKIENSQLYYSFDGWEFVDNQIETTDLVFIYEK